MAQVEFRDGFREVPDHLADMMSGIDTYKMTFDEAVDAANKAAERRVIERAYDSVVKEHFSQGPVR